jgi:hypothetical protein
MEEEIADPEEVVEVHQVAAALAEVAVVEVAAVVVAVKKRKAMKKNLIHSIPVLISCIQLIIINHTFNPISLKGPHFLKFYLILVFGFYASIFALKIFKERISTITFYFMISIFLLGIIKLMKGVFIGKPVGFLIMILILECIVILFISLSTLKYKMK